MVFPVQHALPQRYTEVHRSIHQMLEAKVRLLYGHLDRPEVLPDGRAALESILGVDPRLDVGARAPAPAVASRPKASDVDLLGRSGLVDPLPLLPADVQQVVSSPEL